MRRTIVAVAALSLVILSAACGDIPLAAAVHVSAPTTSTVPSSAPTTECQDHELPCAGPPTSTTTTPVMDPALKDESIVDLGIAQSMRSTTTTTVVARVELPRTS
jgi:hypothetical protein